MSEHEYWQIVRAAVETGHESGEPKHEIREAIIHQVHTAYAAGDPWAADVLTRWSTSGADDDYTRVFKDLNSVTYIRADGRRVRKTVAYSRPLRDRASGEIIGRQIQAWWAMSQVAIEALREEWLERGVQATEVLTALDQASRTGATDRWHACMYADVHLCTRAYRGSSFGALVAYQLIRVAYVQP